MMKNLGPNVFSYGYPVPVLIKVLGSLEIRFPADLILGKMSILNF